MPSIVAQVTALVLLSVYGMVIILLAFVVVKNERFTALSNIAAPSCFSSTAAVCNQSDMYNAGRMFSLSPSGCYYIPNAGETCIPTINGMTFSEEKQISHEFNTTTQRACTYTGQPTTCDSGGASPSSGGASPSSVGASPSSGGVSPSSGGVSPSSGGASPSSGGASPSSGPSGDAKYTDWPSNAKTDSVNVTYNGPDMSALPAYATQSPATLIRMTAPPPLFFKTNDPYKGPNYGVYDLTYARGWTATSYPSTLPVVTDGANLRNMATDSLYLGGFMAVNDTNDVASSVATRSTALKASIKKQCDDFAGAIGTLNLANWTDPTELYQTDAGWGLTNGIVLNSIVNGGRRSTGINTFASAANLMSPSQIFGGPCSWCRPGIGNWIPQIAPLPWTGTAPSPSGGPASAGFSKSSINPLVYVDLKAPPFDKDPNSPYVCVNTCGCTDQILNHIPIAIQPNGGFQLLWRQAGTNKCIVSYFDPSYNLMNSFHFEATDVGGIAAYDDGTAVFVSMMDCDAPQTAQTWSTMNRAVVIMWRGGKLKWAKRLTDPYKRKDTDDSSTRNPTYSEDATGNGNFIMNMGGSQMKYDASSKMIAVYTKMTGGSLEAGGNHWGSRVFQLNESDGSLVVDAFGCSHDILGRLGNTNQGEFVHVCAEDGNTGNKGLSITPLLKSQNTQNYIHLGENTTSQAGWAASRVCSLITRRSSAQGYVMGYMCKSGKVYYDLIMRLFDTNMKPIDGGRLTVVSNPGTVEFSNFHVMPYGGIDQNDDTYLIAYETLSNPTCCPNSGVENRCYGIVASRTWQIVKIVGSTVQNVGQPVTIASPESDPWRMNPEDDPIIAPNGDIIWATFNWSQVVFHRISNSL